MLIVVLAILSVSMPMIYYGTIHHLSSLIVIVASSVQFALEISRDSRVMMRYHVTFSNLDRSSDVRAKSSTRWREVVWVD
jgi:hypothetical protein